MNERIKELAEQATTYIEPTLNSGEGWIFDKEKFAELIVKDSIGVLIDYLEEIDKEQKTPSFIGMAMTSTRIREHFGVG